MTHDLLTALDFAAERHKTQRRKDPAQTPYINHVIEVATILARHGVTDRTALLAAILHDTIEDTDTTPAELAERFGVEVRDAVLEVTDDKSLPKAERKRLQVEHAPSLSHAARLVKLGDKISNVRYVAHHPPASWSIERRREYLDWTEQVIAGLRGANAALEARYDEALREAREEVGKAGGREGGK
jgi:guanosine-3',5'-bis(diphosphate) 3'-pyrophosphohydrolase